MRSLAAPIRVTGDLATIEVSVRVRARGASPAAVFLTTRSQPEAGSGGYALEEKDFAVGVCGYRYADHANYLGYHAGGKFTSEARNTALLPDATNWHTVRMVYERAESRTRVWVNGVAYLEQTGVEVEGAVFSGLWLRGHGAEYDDLAITWTRQKTESGNS